jgi:hypothetical protein
VWVAVPGGRLTSRLRRISRKAIHLRNFAKLVAVAAVPAMAAMVALPALSASASTVKALPAPTNVWAQVTSQGSQSDSVSVHWNYGNYRNVKFRVAEHQGSSRTVVAFTTGHGVTVQVPVPVSQYGANGGQNYTFSVTAIRPGSWPRPAGNSHAGYSSAVNIPGQQPVTIAIVTPVATPVNSGANDTTSYTVAVTGNSPVTAIDTFVNGALQPNERAVGPNAANVGSVALTLVQAAPPMTATAETLTVELLNGSQVLATSAPVVVTLPVVPV